MARRARILVSNDDGIDAPGLRALVKSLVALASADVFVCAPDGERSASSHAITLNREMSAAPRLLEGARAAYAVQGTPADAVMLALNSALFDEDEADDDEGESGKQKDADGLFYPGEADASSIVPLGASAAAAPGSRFDLVVSGINRGDNCGLHVIYSGTVGAAREAACKGVPSVALSVDDHGARSEGAYRAAAGASAAVVAAVLSVLRDGKKEGGGDGVGGEPARWRGAVGAEAAAAARGGSGAAAPAAASTAASTAAAAAWALRQGLVLNVNFPRERDGGGASRGLALCHQGTGCIYPAYKEVGGGGGEQDAAAAGAAAEQGKGGRVRLFRAFAGGARHDDSDWCDTWAVRLGWTSLTPLSLRQDLRLPPGLVPPAAQGGGDWATANAASAAPPSSRDADAQEALAEAGMAAASEVVRRAAQSLGVAAGGHLIPPLV